VDNAKNDELIKYLVDLGYLKTERIIEAFRKAPRHAFVAKEYMDYAYSDTALPFMKESTISQPSTVAIMLELLDLKPGSKVLEIGTGSGWQAALLGHIVGERGKIISMEIDPDIAEQAKRQLQKHKSDNVEVVLRDGSVGYEKGAPYDRIIYTAATTKVPDIVIGQLKKGGMLVAPVGNTDIQRLFLIKKNSIGKLEEESYGIFRFVPLKGKFGQDSFI